MLWNNSKVRAFTLNELLITMMLMIFVMGFTFLTLNYIQKKVAVFSSSLLNTVEYVSAEKMVWQDIQQFTFAEVNQKDQTIVFSSPLSKTKYSFSEYRFTRDNQQLLKSYTLILFYYKGKQITDGRFDAFEIKIYPPEKAPINLFFFFPKSSKLYA